MSPSYYDGPRCPDHHGNAAKGCRDCWQEVHAGTRFAHEIGHHLEAAPPAASLISGEKHVSKLYIAGPMRGIPEFNFPAFDVATDLLATAGHYPINPADHDRANGFNPRGMTGHEDLAELGFSLPDALTWDLQQVAEADGVAVLEGWEKSKGARAEVATALALGKLVATVTEWTYPEGQRTYIGEFAQGGFVSVPVRIDPHEQIIPAAEVRSYGKKFLDELRKPIQPQTSEVRTTSATGGEKGTKPERYDLIPVEALAQVARLYGRGAAKYAAHNWRKGYEWSKSYAAMQRHATQFWAGEDIDEEMQLPHLASVIFHAMALLVFMEEHRGFDDRYTTTGAAK